MFPILLQYQVQAPPLHRPSWPILLNYLPPPKSPCGSCSSTQTTLLTASFIPSKSQDSLNGGHRLLIGSLFISTNFFLPPGLHSCSSFNACMTATSASSSFSPVHFKLHHPEEQRASYLTLATLKWDSVHLLLYKMISNITPDDCKTINRVWQEFSFLATLLFGTELNCWLLLMFQVKLKPNCIMHDRHNSLTSLFITIKSPPSTWRKNKINTAISNF